MKKYINTSAYLVNTRLILLAVLIMKGIAGVPVDPYEAYLVLRVCDQM